MSLPPKKTQRTFGANLRDIRTATGLTQEILAARLGFKRTTAISLWERSATVPEPHTIEKLARALRCAPAALLRDVITPYDALRGKVVAVAEEDGATTNGGASDERPLSAEDWHWLALGRAVSENYRRTHMRLIEEILRENGIKLPSGVALDGRYRGAPVRGRGARPKAGRAKSPSPSAR
jgi:transcriptional regulator with XRE-family HTH domain